MLSLFLLFLPITVIAVPILILSLNSLSLGELDTGRCLVCHIFQHVINPIIFNNNPLAPADLAQLGRPLVLPRAEEVIGVLQAAGEDLAHVAAVAVGTQLLVAVGQHLRHGRVRGLRGGTSSARVPARGGQGQRRWGRGRPAGDGPRAAAAVAPARGRGTPLGQERAAGLSDPASARSCAALRSGSARGEWLLLRQRRAGLTSSARSGAGLGPGRAGP